MIKSVGVVRTKETQLTRQFLYIGLLLYRIGPLSIHVTLLQETQPVNHLFHCSSHHTFHTLHTLHTSPEMAKNGNTPQPVERYSGSALIK